MIPIYAALVAGILPIIVIGCMVRDTDFTKLQGIQAIVYLAIVLTLSLTTCIIYLSILP